VTSPASCVPPFLGLTFPSESTGHLFLVFPQELSPVASPLFPPKIPLFFCGLWTRLFYFFFILLIPQKSCCPSISPPFPRPPLFAAPPLPRFLLRCVFFLLEIQYIAVTAVLQPNPFPALFLQGDFPHSIESFFLVSIASFLPVLFVHLGTAIFFPVSRRFSPVMFFFLFRLQFHRKFSRLWIGCIGQFPYGGPRVCRIFFS